MNYPLVAIVNIDNLLKEKGLSPDEIVQFEEEVNIRIGDSSWLREYKLDVNNPKRETVRQICYNELYNRSLT